jgi:P-type Cu+ transporter
MPQANGPPAAGQLPPDLARTLLSRAALGSQVPRLSADEGSAACQHSARARRLPLVIGVRDGESRSVQISQPARTQIPATAATRSAVPHRAVRLVAAVPGPLAGADIGIAVATGTGAAMAAADITVVHGGVGAVAATVMLARATRRIIRQNLGWAFGYNLLLVPLAAAGILPPVLAAVAMAISPVTVVGNALRLRRFGEASGHRDRPPPPRPGHARGAAARRDTSQQLSPAIAGLTPLEPPA